MTFEPYPSEYLAQVKSKYGDRRKDEFKAESAIVQKYFEAVRDILSGHYSLNKVLAVGGTGIVHSGRHDRFHQPVVLKINRPVREPAEASMVEKEARVLPELVHPNIIAVLDLGTLCVHKSGICNCSLHVGEVKHDDDCASVPRLTYIVEPYIEGSKPFFAVDEDHIKETWLYNELTVLKETIPDVLTFGGGDAGQATRRINDFLRNITAIFSQWVDLLNHLHEHGYVYLDVKPENVLVYAHNHLTSIDYGSVEALDSEDQRPTDVFFTARYAHPYLIERKIHKASSNRVRGGIKRSELSVHFDYFALGVSMLEILNEIAKVREHVVPQLPLYRALHFLATRLLDGKNRDHEHDYPFAKQVFPGLRDRDYRNLAYRSLDDTFRDLKKERGRWNLEDKVPELATYSKDIVRVVPGFNTVLTPRLRSVIEHPLVARLKHVTQLGLVSLVYPTADHSRYDHALGSYTYTTYYVKSLFNDLGNPVFRNLVGTEDVKAVLLAALLHDIGQYPLAHDLEEVQEGIFKHGRIGLELLDNPEIDKHGRTLHEIISNHQNGWNVPIEKFRRVFGAHSKNLDLIADDESVPFKINVLAAIIDGQIDSDKADYIIRDSRRCELPYGAQLDLQRLLRVLTVAILPQETDPEKHVALGVYDKGLISAHAFGQARYQLFSTVYWHHTSRIIKAMLQYAAALALPSVVFNQNPEDVDKNAKETEIREQLVAFIKALVPPFRQSERLIEPAHVDEEPDLDMVAEPPTEAMAALVGDDAGDAMTDVNGETDWYPGIAWTDWLMLEWIRSLGSHSSECSHLVTAIQGRKLYKRVATFPRNEGNRELFEKLDTYSWPEKINLSRKFHERVADRLRRDWGNLNTATPMNESDFEKLCRSELLIIVDVPNPAAKVGYARPLGVVPELKEKSYQQDVRPAMADTGWQEIMRNMLKEIAPIRILCHPDVRNLVSNLYNPVEASMSKLLKQFLGLNAP